VTGERSPWISRIVILLILVGIPAAVFNGPLRRYWLSRAFAEERLREFEQLHRAGNKRSRGLPSRTDKVLAIRPSTHSVYFGSIATTRFWTQIGPKDKGRVNREVDPPQIDASWYDLSASVRADSPEEVSTVIFCESKSTTVGTYGRAPTPAGGICAAYQMGYALKIYDRKSGRFLGQHEISGEAPPEETTALGQHSGGIPEIADFLENLPLRS
jgi:hypothetical protein